MSGAKPYALGDRIQHPTRGAGLVIGAGAAYRGSIKVRFDAGTTHTYNPVSQAKLRPDAIRVGSKAIMFTQRLKPPQRSGRSGPMSPGHVFQPPPPTKRAPDKGRRAAPWAYTLGPACGAS